MSLIYRKGTLVNRIAYQERLSTYTIVDKYMNLSFAAEMKRTSGELFTTTLRNPLDPRYSICHNNIKSYTAFCNIKLPNLEYCIHDNEWQGATYPSRDYQ